MDPAVWGALILVAGGVLLAIAGVITVRTAAKWPELVARITQTEIVANEALEVATKARRLASAQRTRKVTARAAIESDSGRLPEPAERGTQGWFPGATPGRIPSASLPLGSGAPESNGAAHPIGFDDQ